MLDDRTLLTYNELQRIFQNGRKKTKILLIKLSSSGCNFNIPLANALKDAGYEVHWLVSERGVQVIENNPCVDKTIFVPLYKWRKQGSIIENFKEFFSILKQIRAEKYDIAIDAQNDAKKVSGGCCFAVPSEELLQKSKRISIPCWQ